MTTTTAGPAAHRPASPWPGSGHEDRHRWQLEDVRTLEDASIRLRVLAAELTAAHAAGWRLLEPVRGGHLAAVRPSRRERGRAAGAPLPGEDAAPPLPARWRARLVDEPPTPADDVLDLSAAPRTPALQVLDGALRQVAGPPLAGEVLIALAEQVGADDARDRRWGVAPARVGPHVDLVADGSALRLHAVRDGALVRRVEVLAFHHAADRAQTLQAAAAAYERLAQVVDAMAAAGGALTGADDGFLHVAYAG